ncbi:uncharacterized protein LOC108046781 isoform X1 [Drosophila rhopaloa]|uniref:Uncharacterized protein n=1 Tax=Drosophila rhopaloa TaxID=1041015 RepID=A0ABM5HLI8_DRORH|nr:uncharacterized protein LOC108046781 isoform X1 [Drosophila rhopaloa]
MDLAVILLTVLSLLSIANGAQYELTVLDEEIFSICPNSEPGTLDMNGLMDLSELKTSMNAEGITVSGNSTLRWDIQLEDRVQMNVNLLYFDRGSWTPTVFSQVFKDFCKSMYDSSQLHYKYWSGHITNDVRNKCVSVPGTKMMYETYSLSMTAGSLGPLREGSYKANIMLRAYDSMGAERATRICFEIKGDLFKIRKKR